MKNLKNLSKLILLFLVSTLAMPAFSQGVAIYKKDGTMVKYAYEEIDSIVTYNYGETPETPENPDTPVTPPAETQYEAVDLGLPSGIKWATCNVGATKPEEYGGYYAWGETEEKFYCGWDNYKWCNGSVNTMTKYSTGSAYGTIDNKTVLEHTDDVANVKWGGKWRMPTRADFNELSSECSWQSATLNGIKGFKVTSKTNGNSIFLPCAGQRSDKGISDAGGSGYYWSSSLCDNTSNRAYVFDLHNAYTSLNYNSRCKGYSVRPVCD
jgi:uncharacterized protein (TIGR02145 family)